MRSGNRRRGSGYGIAAMAVLLLWSLVVTASPAAAGTFLSVTSAFPPAVTVGETAAALITITNNSTPPESPGVVTLSSITLVPTCGTVGSGDCPGFNADPNVFQVTQALGAGGTACAGVNFSIVVVDAAQGKVRFDSPSPVVLGTPGGATATCRIDLTFQVLRRNSRDAQPGSTGQQTVALAAATGTSGVTGTTSTAAGTSVITVHRATPTISTLASPQTVAVGQEIGDRATVTGVPGGPVPTSGVGFLVYADPPGAEPCSGPSQIVGLVGLSPVSESPPVGSALSPLVVTTSPGTYRFVAGYIGDANYESLPNTPCGEPGENVEVKFGTGRYTPLTPARILDTRVGTGGVIGPLGPGSTTNVQVSGQGGVPQTGVSAVALNVTVTEPTGDGYLTIFPGGHPRPLAANLNFTPGKTVPNLVVVGLGVNGTVDVFNSSGDTHVIYDVAGWFSHDTQGNDGRYVGLLPARILDTRTGTGGSSVRLGPGASLDVQVAGQGGVPGTGVRAVVMNVAVTNTSAQSYLTVHPTGEPLPLAANLNWVAGNTVSNRVIAKLGANGRVTVYNAAGDTDVVIDVNGWFSDTNAVLAQGLFTPVTPYRILDSRTGAGGAGPLAAGGTLDVRVGGAPDLGFGGFSAVVLNVTVVNPEAAGYLTMFPIGSPQPLASDLNYAAGEIRPNLVVVRLAGDFQVSIFTSATTDLVIDVAGWIT